MALGSGLAAQLGLVTETTYGTAATVTRFYPFVSESLVAERERLESDGIIAGARVRRTGQWAPGTTMVSGDVQLELYQQHAALLFSHMLGSLTSSATAGVATHTATPGDLTGKSMTVQIGRPGVNGTVYPFTYTGVKVQEWEIAAEAGEIVTLGLTLIGQDETTSISLASASYGTDAAKPYVFTHGAAVIAGTTASVRSVTIHGNNGLADDRTRLGFSTIDEPLEADLRVYDGTISMELANTTQYDAYRAGSEFSVVLSLSASSTARVTVTMNARFDGASPTVDSRGLIVVDHPIVMIGNGTDANAITAVIVNSQTTP